MNEKTWMDRLFGGKAIAEHIPCSYPVGDALSFGI